MGSDLATWYARRGLPPAKLSRPDLRGELLARPRLVAALDELAERRVIVVSGPAGAGKTVAVAQWLAAREQAFAWVTLDEAEADPGTLVRDVLGALAGPGWVPEPRAWPRPHEPVDVRAWWIEHVVLPLAGDGPPVVLVLDDAHGLAAPAVLEALGWLVRNCPSRLRLVLVGHRAPALPLARLEAAGAVGRLPVDALWLRADESSALLQRLLGPAATPERCTALHERSGGWPAALRLMALAEGVPAEVSVASRRAIELVAEEVLDRQPPDRRAVLLDTAVLDTITPAMCTALGGRDDAEAVLWSLADEGLALPVGQGAGFRVLPLLRAALARRLEPAHRRRLHALASRHLAAHDRLDEALDHAEAAGDEELAAELAATHGFSLLRARRMGRLARLLSTIDEHVRGASPLLATLDAWAALRQRPEVTREALERARSVVAGLPAALPVRATLVASLAALDTFVTLRLGQAPADLDGRLADQAGLPTGLVVALALAAGLVAEREGDSQRALARLERAARLALAATPALPSAITALAHRTRVLRRAGRVDEARGVVEQGRAAIEDHRWSGFPVAAELELEQAMLELDAGQHEAAERRIIAGLHALRLGDDPAAIARGLLGLAMARRARHDDEGAADAAAQAEAVARDAGITFLAAAARSLLEPPSPPLVTVATVEPISARELEVLELVAQGLSNQVVARRLFISPVTVKTHVHHILTKLAAKNRTEAVHRARAQGLLR